jgi:hypothetical protein
MNFNKHRENAFERLQANKPELDQNERKIHTVRPAGLKTRRSFSYTIITKKSCF